MRGCVHTITHYVQMGPPAQYLWLIVQVWTTMWVCVSTYMCWQLSGGMWPSRECAHCEHVWAYEEGEVFQMWQLCTDARTLMPTRAGRFAPEHAPTYGSSHVSEQSANMSIPTRGHHLHAPRRHYSITHHPLFSRCVVSDHQHHRAAGGERRKGHSQALVWVDSAVPMPCQCDSYRSVLALGTVPGRLISRSLRLMEEKESRCEPVGRCCHQCHSARAGVPPAPGGSTCPAVLAPCGWRTPQPFLL